jgi:thioredoxin 1
MKNAFRCILSIFLLSAVSFPAVGVDANIESKVIPVTDADFEAAVLNSKLPVIVYFSADWCGPCNMLRPSLDELARTFKGKARLAMLNADESPATFDKYEVRSVPSFILFKDGKPAARQVGAAPKVKLEQWINAEISSSQSKPSKNRVR